MTVSDYPDFGTPGQNVPGSPQGGVGLLRVTDNLGNATGQVLLAGTGVNLFTAVPVTQPGYEALFEVNLPAGAGTVPFLEVELQWGDSATSLFIDVETFVVTAGNGPLNALNHYINGPVRGNQLSVTVFNLDNAQNMTLTWTVNQTSHVFEHDRLLQPGYATTAPIGFTNPTGTPSLGLVAASQPTIAPATTTSRLTAACNHKMVVNVDNSGGVNALAASLNDPGVLYQTVNGLNLYKWLVAAGAIVQAVIQFPNGPLLLAMRNQGTTGNITPTVTIHKSEY